jgi:hypothetical protein
VIDEALALIELLERSKWYIDYWADGPKRDFAISARAIKAPGGPGVPEKHYATNNCLI